MEDSVYEHVKESIPQKGLVYESENRGNVVVFNVEREKYELYFQNHSLMPFNIPVLLEEGSYIQIESIDYLVVLVDEMAEGYYEVRKTSLKLMDGMLSLAVDVRLYRPFKFGWKQIGKYENGDNIPLDTIILD